ncbi:hypothetical protein Hanom_Chr12g01177471 [Helianthus anomalus]
MSSVDYCPNHLSSVLVPTVRCLYCDSRLHLRACPMRRQDVANRT